MTAAKVMDIKSRLPGCSGQAADAVSPYTQVKMEDASTFLKIPKSECPDIWIRLPKHKNGQNHGPVWKIQSFLLNGICTVLFWQDCYGKGIRKSSTGTRLGKVLNWECFIRSPRKRTILICSCGQYQTGRQNRKHRTDLEIPIKDVDLGEPTSFLDHVNLGCTQRECKINNDIVASYRDKFESRISAGATEKLPENKSHGETCCRNRIFLVLTWKVMQRNVWKDIANLRLKQLSN